MEPMKLYRVETSWGSIAHFITEEAALVSVTMLPAVHGWVKAYKEEYPSGKSVLIAASAEVK